jgi:hypothetical protein
MQEDPSRKKMTSPGLCGGRANWKAARHHYAALSERFLSLKPKASITRSSFAFSSKARPVDVEAGPTGRLPATIVQL